MDMQKNDIQIRDLGMSRNGLEEYLVRTGYWGTSDLRTRYGFTLSPSAYVISETQMLELVRLARLTYAAVGELNQELCKIAGGKGPQSHKEGRLLRLANTASRNLLRPSDDVRAIPPILKIDLVQDAVGKYRIVEVDAYNPRGLGYVALLEGMLPETLQPHRFPGMSGIAKLLSGQDRWNLLVSEFERYYEMPFRIFADAARKFGLKVDIMREGDLAAGRSSIPDPGGRVLVIPESLDQYPSVREDLMARYRSGSLETFFPPAAYLGSKAFLPYLRTCTGMEEFIPQVTLVGRKCGSPEQAVDFGKPLVLKAAVSSGLKKVIFSDLDEALFSERLAEVREQKSAGWIVQQQVPQVPTPVVVFDENGDRTVLEYYFRVTAYIGPEGVIDVEVTGRPDRKVHGAPDCIQLPTIFA